MLAVVLEDHPLLDPLPPTTVTVVIRNEADDNRDDLDAGLEVSNLASIF